MSTIFKEDSFSSDSTELYDRVVSDDKLAQNLAVISNYDWLSGSHSRGVTQIIAEFVTSGLIDIDPQQKENFVRVAALHDIGKLSVVKSILDKPGVLTKKEWHAIENHPIDGFHRYSLQYNPREALPILMHHTLQPNYYPTAEKMKKDLDIYNIPLSELTDEKLWEKTVALAVADNIEARFPILYVDNPSSHIRKYSTRNYPIEKLTEIINGSFSEAGKVRELGLVALLDNLLEYSNDTFLRKQ